MPLVVEACERPIKTFDSSSCPLCEDWRPTSVHNNAKHFSRHLARHLQQLSLASIPISTPGLEIRISVDALEVGDGSSNGSSDRESVQQERDISVPTNRTSIFLAAEKGDQDIVKELLMEGADVKKTDPDGRTPIEWAAENDHVDIVRPLVDDGTVISGSNFPYTAAEKVLRIIQQDLRDSSKELPESIRSGIEKSERRTHDGKIRFTDAVGRKISFPFHLCATWQGMEERIKQAFVHVDVFGRHVMEGRYDLIGLDSEMILPSAWGEVIQPDWSITMVMWPMHDVEMLKPGHPHTPVSEG